MSRSEIPSFAALKAFVLIGRLGGIRRAADVLGVSHAVVSRHLRGLEEQIGITLFERSLGRLTGAGADYHREIAEAFNQIRAATEALYVQRGERLTVWCAPGLAVHWLTRRLQSFVSRPVMPAIDLQASDAAPDLLNNQADADLRYIPDSAAKASQRGIAMVELARAAFFPVAAPELAARLAPGLRSAADLAGMPLIEEGQGEEWRHWFAAQGIPYVSSGRAARFGHAHLTLVAARAGQGVALANHYLVGEDLAAGSLVVLDGSEQALTPICLGAYVLQVCASRANHPPLRRFRRWLQAEFEQDSQRECSERTHRGCRRCEGGKSG